MAGTLKDVSKSATEKKENIDLEELCRLCLQETTELISIFNNADEDCSLPIRIMACAALEVQQSDMLPKNICMDCRKTLEKFYYFRTKSKNIDTKLRRHIRLVNLGKPSDVLNAIDDEHEEDYAKSLELFAKWEQQKLVLEEDEKLDEERRFQEALNEALEIERKKIIASARKQAEDEMLRKQNRQKVVENQNIAAKEAELAAQEVQLAIQISNLTTKEAELNAKESELAAKKIARDGKLPSTAKPELNPSTTKVYSIVHKRSNSQCSESDIMLHEECADKSILDDYEDENLQRSDEQISSGDNDDEEDSRSFRDGYPEYKDFNENNEQTASSDTESTMIWRDAINDENVMADDMNAEFLDSAPVIVKSEELYSQEAEYLDEDFPLDEEDAEITEYKQLSSIVRETIESKLKVGSNFKYEVVKCAENVTKLKVTTSDRNVIFVELENQQAEYDENGEMKIFQCSICTKSFSRRIHLTRHASVHGNKQGHVCSACDKWFPSKSSMSRHMRTHTGEKPFKCDICERTFIQKEILKRHYMIHTGERPFQCNFCRRSFTQKEVLRQHINRNHTEDPIVVLHQCPKCPKSFYHASGLSRHILIHSGRKFSCTVCAKAFNDKSALKRHLVALHKY